MTRRVSSVRRIAAALVGAVTLLGAGSLVTPAAQAAEAATLSVTSTGHAPGGKLRLEGKNWFTADGSAGSKIAVKFDLGGISRLPGQTVHPNATIWQLVEAGGDGVLNVDIQLPTGATTGTNGSTPAFTTGDHSVTLLTGSLKPGDVVRSLSADFTVSSSGGTPTPVKPTNAKLTLGQIGADGMLPLTSSGFTAGQGLYRVTIDDGAKFSSPANGNPDGTLSLTSLSPSSYGLGAGQHTVTVSWAADNTTLASGTFSVSSSGGENPSQPGGGSQGIDITAEVRELQPSDGSLALSIPNAGTGVKLAEGAAAGDRRVFTGALPTVTVSDSRNAAQAAGGGWSTSGQVGNFSAGGNTMTAAHLGWTPKVLTPKAGLTAGSTVASGLTSGAGLSKASTLASADNAARTGSADLGADLALQIPVDAAAGTYRGTLTVSLFPTD